MSTYDWAPAEGSPVADDVAEDILRFGVDHGPRWTVLSAHGEIDALTGTLFVDRIVETVEAAAGTVVIDLTGIGFFGSAGIAALVEARNAARRCSLGLRLVCDGRTVLMPLTVAGVLDQFDVYPDLDAAVSLTDDVPSEDSARS